MSLADINRLKHMLDAAIEARNFMKGLTFEKLPDDQKTLQAVTRSLEIIGEAASKITDEFNDKHPDHIYLWKKIVNKNLAF